jgi:molybdenum cofactor guanylyltransferase
VVVTIRGMAFAAGIVLAGGRSSRMGTAKAGLEWHGSTLLRRVTGVVARSVDGPVVVVRASGQHLPRLDPAVEVHDDPQAGLGPMQGLAAGLAALTGRAEVAFVCSTDLPFLHPAFVRAVLDGFDSDHEPTDRTEGVEVVVPVLQGFVQPLSAAYRTSLLPVVQRMLETRRLRLGSLLDDCRVRRLDEAALLRDPALAAADPGLESVMNVNRADEYESARSRPAPEVVVERAGKSDQGGEYRVRAATLAAAAAHLGMQLDGVVAAVNGHQVPPDAELPLVAGDVVRFHPAHADNPESQTG